MESEYFYEYKQAKTQYLYLKQGRSGEYKQGGSVINTFLRPPLIATMTPVLIPTLGPLAPFVIPKLADFILANKFLIIELSILIGRRQNSMMDMRTKKMHYKAILHCAVDCISIIQKHKKIEILSKDTIRKISGEINKIPKIKHNNEYLIVFYFIQMVQNVSKPYLFTNDELQVILHSLDKHDNSHFQHHVLPIIIHKIKEKNLLPNSAHFDESKILHSGLDMYNLINGFLKISESLQSKKNTNTSNFVGKSYHKSLLSPMQGKKGNSFFKVK